MDTNSTLKGIEAFAETRRAIVVAAHADDMETLMGGTLALLREQGVIFHEVIATLGDIGSTEPQWTRESLAAVRVDEAKAAAALLGVESVEFYGYHDGELEETLELRARIAQSYRRFMPDTLFTFDPTGFLMNHPDHRAIGRSALDAVIPSRMRLYHPEDLDDAAPLPMINRVFLWTPARLDVAIDITAGFERKLEVCLAHKSQFPDVERLGWMRSMSKTAGERIGVELAEGFGMV